MASRLILNADDFGLTPGINRAVVDLHRAGALSSATLMATGGAFKDAIACAQTSPTLGVGCHVVFVDGTPVSAPTSIPTLIGPDGKRFRTSLVHFACAARLGAIDPADLVREATAQVEKLQHAGLQPTHLDTHKHTHCLPLVARALVEVARRCQVGAMRHPFEPAWSVAVSKASPLRRLQVHALSSYKASFRALLAASPGAIATAGTLGIAATGTLDAEVLRATLARAAMHAGDATYELCCHPGLLDRALEQQPTRLLGTRAVEYAALLDFIPQFLRTPGAPTLIHYGELDASGQSVPVARHGPTAHQGVPDRKV